MHRNAVRPQLEVVLATNLASAGERLLDIVEVTVDDLLGETERPVEDLAHLLELQRTGSSAGQLWEPGPGMNRAADLREEVRVRRGDGRVVLGRRSSVGRERPDRPRQAERVPSQHSVGEHRRT